MWRVNVGDPHMVKCLGDFILNPDSSRAARYSLLLAISGLIGKNRRLSSRIACKDLLLRWEDRTQVMISTVHTIHAIADNFQGICSKHHDNGILKPTMADIDRLYVHGTKYSLPG